MSAYNTKTESELKNGEKRIVLRFTSPVGSNKVMKTTCEAIAAVVEALLETATSARSVVTLFLNLDCWTCIRPQLETPLCLYGRGELW